MTYRIVSRAEIGLPERVLMSDGITPRPRLAGERWYTLHDTGVPVAFGDIGDTAAEIRSIERWAQGQGKPNEYNYVIDQDDTDAIYAYAGPFQAAHSAGENDESIGVLFLNGTSEPLTDTQIDKARWLRDVHLIPAGVLAADVVTLEHHQMPGAQTSCSVVTTAADVIAIRRPWLTSERPPLNASAGLLARVRDGDGWWSIARRVMADGANPVTVAALEAANPNTALHPGTLVRIPGRAS
jgi:hypothetical protein